MLEDYEGGYLINSTYFAGILFASDAIIRPQATGSDVMEIIKFGVEGYLMAWVFNYSQTKCVTDDDKDPPETTCSKDDTTIADAIIAAIAIFLTDKLLRIADWGDSMGQKMLKFLIQGMLINATLTWRDYSGRGM